MQVPYVKYIETLVVGKLSDVEIQKKLTDLNITFPDKGIQIVRERFVKERHDYFYGNDDIDLVWLED